MKEAFWSLDAMWCDALRRIETSGVRLNSRDGECREIVAYQASLRPEANNWLWNNRRNASPVYAAAELLWYLKGTDAGSMITAYAPKYARFLNKYGNADGAYGRRWAEYDQLKKVIEILTKPETRQAVITCWKPTDLDYVLLGTCKDVPCTLSIQFLNRRGSLHVIVTMRSNDVWLGMPYDVWCFSSLQRIIASILGLNVGYYTHQVGSMHLYSRHFKAASEVTDQEPSNDQTRLPIGQLTSWEMFRTRLVSILMLEDMARKGILQGDVLSYPDAPDLLDECGYLCLSRWGRPIPTWVNAEIRRRCR